MSEPAATGPELRDITGPSALGGGWRRSAELLYLIAAMEFRRSYHGTVLGYLWSLCRPLLLFGVLYVVFTQALSFGSGVKFYAPMLLFNIVLFGFFQEATGTAVSSIVVNEPIVRKTQFPRLVIPLSVVMTAFFNLTLNMVVVVVFLLVSGVQPRWSWFGLPLLLAAMFAITTAVSMIVAALYPRFRDIGIIWSVALTALFYATPVLYPLTHVSQRLREILSLNPLAPVFELAQRWIINPEAPGPVAITGGWGRLMIPAALFVLVCLFAVWIFRREAPRIAEDL